MDQEESSSVVPNLLYDQPVCLFLQVRTFLSTPAHSRRCRTYNTPRGLAHALARMLFTDPQQECQSHSPHGRTLPSGIRAHLQAHRHAGICDPLKPSCSADPSPERCQRRYLCLLAKRHVMAAMDEHGSKNRPGPPMRWPCTA